MTQEINNENSEMESPEIEPRNDELHPVKSKSQKILSAGVNLLLGGAIITLAGSILIPVRGRTMGATQSSRLTLESRKAEYDKAVQAEKVEEDKIELTEDGKQIN